MNRSPLPLGHIFEERYVIAKPIGSGRMSSVYLARDRMDGDVQVALKILDTPDATQIKRELFRRETGSLKRLSHANIVQLRDSGWSESEDAFYLTLDYLPYSLDKILNGDAGEIGSIDNYKVMREIAEAVVSAHAEQVVHRDIKPSNILLDATGRPMLTDFGISKLVDQLTVGQTLAGYWSSGYASPEQRARRAADPSSDVYSLGATFYHLLSGQEPPPDGPTPDMVDRHVAERRPIQLMLKRMLSPYPEQRPSSGSDLLTALEAARRSESLPTYHLVLTHRARTDIVSSAYALNDDFESIAEAIRDELGGVGFEEVHLQVRAGRNQDQFILMGDSLRLVCVLTDDQSALLVVAAQGSYAPTFEGQKLRAMPIRAVWEIAQYNPDNDEARDAIAELMAEISTHERVGVVERERHGARREFLETWNSALQNQQSNVQGGSKGLLYDNVEKDGDYLRFRLRQPAPENLGWEDDASLAVQIPGERQSQIPVGNLVSIQGRTLETARDYRRSFRRRRDIPESGVLVINAMEALVSIRRQRDAISTFLFDSAANPKLSAAIMDPARSTRRVTPFVQFFQDWLSDDKKEAVRKALSSNELFLIQGPPGTGKTSVIAEIALQILKADPDARILLASQSNIAVDHALSQIAEASCDSPPEMVRVGREERIAAGGQNWTLQARARSWRNEVLSRLQPVHDGLLQEEREARAAVRESATSTDIEFEDSESIDALIAEAKAAEALVMEYQTEYASLDEDADDSVRYAATEMVQLAREELAENIAALKRRLGESPAMDWDDGRESAALAGVLGRIEAARAGGAGASDPLQAQLARIQSIRRVLADWTKVVGRGEDFEDLIGKSARIVGATCLFSANLFKENRWWETRASQTTFDWAIVDEAGRATVPEILVPIVRADRAILVGDERQLPPMVDDELVTGAPQSEDDVALETSLFQILAERTAGESREYISGLRTQYRMHPAIGNLISSVFYDGELENGLAGRDRQISGWMGAPAVWLSTSSRPRRQESGVDSSYVNREEVEVIQELLHRLDAKLGNRAGRPSVGVIAGYSAQVETLRTQVDPDNERKWRNISIEIATVDAFQGRECDVVIYSTVRSNRQGRIGFLRDTRRINVALSRARDLLVIVGDAAFMRSARMGVDENPFASVLDYMDSHQDECRILNSEMVKFL